MVTKLGTTSFNMSKSVPQNPITYIATAIALAMVIIRPIAPPNSGPEKKSNLIKYFPIDNHYSGTHIIMKNKVDYWTQSFNSLLVDLRQNT